MGRLFLSLMLFTAVAPAIAEEGMWTFDGFPSSVVKRSYGVDITSAWLDHLRLSTVRLAGCTGSFVSAEGLILTNQHCAESCLAEISSQNRNFVDLGFAAPNRRAEQRCSTQIADVLIGTDNVTDQVRRAVAGLTDKAANDARNNVLTGLELACEQASRKSSFGKLVCQSVTLYQGGQYFIYKYKRYDDVRLVFAPEADIAEFGGDPDNFQFPRWCLDFSVLRAYEQGRPARTRNHLRVDFAGPRENELVFVVGHPGTTGRQLTRAQFEFDRDVALPTWLLRASELRGRYIQFGKSSMTEQLAVEEPLNILENSIKVRRKLLDALHDDVLMERKTREESELKAKSDLTGGDPWPQIEAAVAREREIYLPYMYLERAVGFNCALFRYARVLVRGAEERAKPDAARLLEYVDTEIPRLEQQLFAPIASNPQFEILTLSFGLERMREWLGPDNPVVRKVLVHDSPDSLAARLVGQTKLGDPAFRKQLWLGGQAAIDASDDPMILLARAVDGESRAIRKEFEDDVNAPIALASEKIAALRLKAFGANDYPDATNTLRLNYGTVQGWVENGTPVEPFTHLYRTFERATGAASFKIPDSWLKAHDRLDMQIPFDLTTNNDIVGGNSGSPLVDARGRIVGVVFDGNIHSISGYYRYDAAKNRAIAVDSTVIREALEKVAGAQSLLAEIESK